MGTSFLAIVPGAGLLISLFLLGLIGWLVMRFVKAKRQLTVTILICAGLVLLFSLERDMCQAFWNWMNRQVTILRS